MRLGVFGGTFDPPHLGHLIVASEAHAALGLERLLFVPAAEPPHKQGRVCTPAELRLQMVRAATAGDARFEVSDLELRRSGASYTVDTLRVLRERYAGAELLLLLGADQAREMLTWREPQQIARLARLVVLAREGEAPALPAGLPSQPLVTTRIDLSASAVRRRVRAGLPIRYLVPDAVRELVEREKLYT